MQGCLPRSKIILVKKIPFYLYSEWTMLLAGVHLLVFRAILIFELAEDLVPKKHFVLRGSR